MLPQLAVNELSTATTQVANQPLNKQTNNLFKMTILCTDHSQQLVALFLISTLAMVGCVQPQHKRRQQQFQRIFNQPTPYPAAGFRPDIPFDLPRQPKNFQPTFSISTSTSTMRPNIGTTTQASVDINIETLEQTTNIISDQLKPTERIPSNTYGAPTSERTELKTDVNSLSETEMIYTPAEHLEPPSTDAAKNFNTDYVGEEQLLVADVPVVDGVDSFNAQPQQPFNTFNRRVELPNGAYGVPDLADNEPDTGISTDCDNGSELEFNEPDNELAQLLVANNAALNRLSALKTGRFILMPADNSNLRQIYFANFANNQRLSRLHKV